VGHVVLRGRHVVHVVLRGRHVVHVVLLGMAMRRMHVGLASVHARDGSEMILWHGIAVSTHVTAWYCLPRMLHDDRRRMRMRSDVRKRDLSRMRNCMPHKRCWGGQRWRDLRWRY